MVPESLGWGLRVLGIDPGSRKMGWGLVEESGGDLRGLASGVIACGSGEISLRLAKIDGEVGALIERWEPGVVALEQAFLGKSVTSALRLGEVRGVVLAVAGRRQLPAVDYAPATVKVAVAGSGAAQKDMVARGVNALLGVEVAPGDASDALAVAICHLRHARFESRLRSATVVQAPARRRASGRGRPR